MTNFFKKNSKTLSHAFAGVTTVYLIDGIAMNIVKSLRGELFGQSLHADMGKDIIPNSFLQFIVGSLRKVISGKIHSSDLFQDLDPYSKAAVASLCLTPFSYAADMHLYKSASRNSFEPSLPSFGYFAASEVISNYDLISYSSGNFFESQDRNTFYRSVGGMSLLVIARIASAPFLQKSLNIMFGSTTVPRERDVDMVGLSSTAALEFLLRAATPSVYRLFVRAYGTLFGYRP